MAKTELTKELERNILNNTRKMGVFGCFEVTIGFGGNERVDFMTYDTKETWRCYEIKVSKSDFHSKAHNTFIGHFNYYIMPKELYEQVKNEIPNHIGVYVNGSSLVKNPKRQELKVDVQILKSSMIRSLYREFEIKFKSEDANIFEHLKNEVNNLKSEVQRYRKKYYDLYYENQSKKYKQEEF
jgi:hypothetical protein